MRIWISGSASVRMNHHNSAQGAEIVLAPLMQSCPQYDFLYIKHVILTSFCATEGGQCIMHDLVQTIFGAARST